ncbi:MAG: hypothetical protein OHK0053_04270 [Microscillaceae bacterium]
MFILWAGSGALFYQAWAWAGLLGLSCTYAPAQEIEPVEVSRFLEAFTHDSLRGRKAGTPDADRAARMIAEEFGKIGLGYFEKLDGYLQSFDYDDKSYANVVGVISGQGRKNEYILFSAHYDHIGVLRPVGGDSIANGADDDASGVAAVIALARYFQSQPPPERTLVFVAFTAEEIGGYGANHFAEQIQARQYVAGINIEMIGKISKQGPKSAFITGFEKSDLGTLLQKNTAESGFSFFPDPYPSQNLFYRSDNARFAQMGIPAHTISSVQIDRDRFYHSVDDELNTLDVENLCAIIRAIALGMKPLVLGEATPERIRDR